MSFCSFGSAGCLGTLGVGRQLDQEVVRHELLLFGVATELFVLFHSDAVVSQVSGRQRQ